VFPAIGRFFLLLNLGFKISAYVRGSVRIGASLEDSSNEPAAVTQVEKIISGDISCSKSSGGIACTCSGGLVWNGTHCRERVDGGWCEWYPISHCNVSCGHGHQEMMRQCSCPWPGNGGSPCTGPERTFHVCSQQNCSKDKVDGKWCNWLPSVLCNVSCGHGHQEMIRYCECPAPENGGAYCIGENKTSFSCFQGNCTPNKINGGWCKWHKASPCSASCGAGTQEMVRYCSCPTPGNGGNLCTGQNRTVVSCFEPNCANSTANETCDFEFGLSKGKCIWTQDKTDDFDWKREYSSIVRVDVRPVTDHTLRNQYGHYMRIQYNEQKYMDKARLLSGLRGATNATCFKFWYDIQGSSAGSLNIYLVDGNGRKLIWTTSGDQKNRWQYGSVEFSSPTVYMLAIEGTVGRDSKRSSNGDIAIDDVSIVDGSCPLPEIVRCNHTLKGNRGTLTSPFYPEYYPDSVLCFYDIEASLGYSIHVQLNSLNMQNSQSCNDSLKIYEKGLLKKTFCGNYNYVQEYKSIGNTLLLVFQSDGNGTGTGFNGWYKATETPCQFNLTSAFGKFSFPIPRYPWKKCTFRIDVPEGKLINIKYNGSSYPTSQAFCYVSNFMTIYEGGIGSQYSMRRICKNSTGVYRSYGSTTYIQVASTQFLISATYSAISTAEDCNYNITREFNRIASPGYPHSYPNNVVCNYFIEVAKDNAIQVQFTYMSLATNPLCGDVITFYDMSNGMEKRLCENQNGVVWTSRGNKARLTFKSDSSLTLKGFSGYAFEIVRPCNYTFTSPTGNFTSPGYPNKFPRGVTCEFQIKAPYGKSVKIDFDRTLYPFWQYCKGYVTIYEDAIDEKTVKTKFCGQGPKSYQSFSNNVYVVFISKFSAIPYKGFYANYSVVDQVCNYTLEAPAFNFTSPGYPNAYPNGIFCQYRFKIALGQAVKIYFTEFSLESSESCAKDAVSLYENGNLSTVVCGLKSFSNPWMSVGDSVVMRFKSDRSHTSKGFYGYFSFFTYPCDKHFTSPSGNFSSPGYPRGKSCWYHITVASGKGVKIDFRVISLKANSVCYDEYIKIYEDTTTTEDAVKAKYCGRGSRTFYSYSNVVHIFFKPMHYGSQLPVFFANYSEIDKACIYTVSTAHRYATSPGYPNNYYNNLNCRYSFEFLKSQIVEIVFSTFSVQSSESCANDSVMIYEKDTLRATYCGRSAKKWTSTINTVTIVFQTDSSVTSGGFYAYVTWKDKVYENFLTAPAGNFSSPDFPGPYPLNGKSVYHITVDKSKSIKINFPIFNMQCALEKVYIYEDEATAYKQRAILCGPGPKSFTSYSNKVIISFQANKFTALQGFYGVYSEVDKVCDYVLTPPMTTFSSPGYKYQTKYANNSYCRYHFKVPAGKTMKISFEYLSLQSSESCSKDSVKVYENSVLKATYCGFKKYGFSLSLHESEAVMIFQSDSSNSSYGFYGSYSILDQLCRYTFTSPSGNFKSPEIPCKFARGTECQYHITVGKGKGIKIDFPVVQLLQSELCNDEYVSIYEGSIQYETRKATFCGSGSRTFQSFVNKIYVVFHSSLFHKSFHRFHANYTETDIACNYNLEAPSYTFSSPGYPSYYPNITDCQYHFKVADGRSIRLSFNFISLQSSPSCKEASIKIYESGTLKETICGERPATKTWFSIGNEVFMTFQANSSTSSKGFYGSFSPMLKPCFYSYTSENGNFSSIGYPNKYQNRARCDYDIKVRQGNMIKLDFQSFDLEYSLTCRYDYLKIYNVFKSSINLAATFCGTGARTFVSNSSQLLIQFRSDETVTGNGFFVKFFSL